jgi:arginyl-tRNA synthetase
MKINLIGEITGLLQKYHKKVLVMMPKMSKFGHISTNILHLKDDLKIINKIEELDFVEKTERVGGFLNIWVKTSVFNSLIAQVNCPQDEKNHRINLEFCSPNPTGPLHMGHARNIVHGFSLFNLFRMLKYNIKSEIYINDHGTQAEKFRESVQAVLAGKESPHYPVENPEEFRNYVGDPVNLQLERIMNTLEKLGVRFDYMAREANQERFMPLVLKTLTDAGVLHQGQIPNQKVPGDVSALVNREIDNYQVLQRPSGQYTYFALDIAYLFDKKLRGFTTHIGIMGADHVDHIKRMKYVSTFFPPVQYEAIASGMIGIKDADGQRKTMSKRAGNVITIDFLLEKFGKNAVISGIMAPKISKGIDIQLQNFPRDLGDRFVLMEKKLAILLEEDGFTDSMEVNDSMNRLLSHLIFFPEIYRQSANKRDTHILFDFASKFIVSIEKVFETHPLEELKTRIISKNTLILAQKHLKNINHIFHFSS